MSTNRFYHLIAASLLCSAFCAVSAWAAVDKPAAYQELRAVELNPGHTPQLASGFNHLSGTEHTYGERLPVQLRGPVKRIESVRYIPVRSKQKVKRVKTVRF